ncbi:MAG: auxin-binding protein 1 [Gammaproteobacteria bacterium]|nr:MAG: auxin-binding protein 1 [Gammaproteobacteria bacterium]RLA13249.1 MAG: auxin-binding protein 1 [Gammaproteobacteria bacterium]
MSIQTHDTIQSHTIPGITHKTLAGPEHGVSGFEVWEQWIEPHQATPMHRHNCEEVITVFSGKGEVIVDGERTEFGANTTLRVPANAVHQINNIGDEVMHLVATLGMSPVIPQDADGNVFALPWQQQA